MVLPEILGVCRRASRWTVLDEAESGCGDGIEIKNQSSSFDDGNKLLPIFFNVVPYRASFTASLSPHSVHGSWE